MSCQAAQVDLANGPAAGKMDTERQLEHGRPAASNKWCRANENGECQLNGTGAGHESPAAGPERAAPNGDAAQAGAGPVDVQMSVPEGCHGEPVASEPASKRAPRRKASVFSHDGFQNLHQLDQKALRRRSIPQEVAATANSRQAGVQAAGASKQQAGEQPTSSSSSSASSASDQVRRSVRSDTLGSTGSSRASSCDEPAIVVLQPDGSSGQASGAVASKRVSAPTGFGHSLARQERIPLDHRHHQLAASLDGSVRRKCSLGTNATSSNSSSSSSLDSIGWQPEQLAAGRQQRNGDQIESKLAQPDDGEPAVGAPGSDEQEASDANSKAPAPSLSARSGPPGDGSVPPPFQSIKTQLDGSSKVPNAQLIQQHIDKLISQNEAIIDNWNLVSIRSYNSSRLDLASAQHQQGVSAKSRPDQHSQSPGKPTSGASRGQRWSTTALGSGVLLRQSSPTQLAPKLCGAAASSPGSEPGQSVGVEPTLHRYSSSDFAKTAVAHRMRPNIQSAARKRSAHCGEASFSSPSPSLSSVLAARAQRHQQSPADTPISGQNKELQANFFLGTPVDQLSSSSSLSVPSSPRPNVSVLDVQRFLSARFGSLSTSLGPSSEPASNSWLRSSGCHDSRPAQSIESAIESLSLRRREEEAQLYQQPMFLAHQRPGLILAQQQAVIDEASLAEALLFERHQQLLAASHHHQWQVIEQQLDQLRASHLGAAIEHEHQQRIAVSMLQQNASAPSGHHHRQRQQFNSHSRQQVADALTTIHRQLARQDDGLGSSSSATCQHYLREHQALESHLLNEFLAKMMLDREEQQRDPSWRQLQLRPSMMHLEHGTELLTQSLDSATPAHRCDACDISFWTKDLLNYHLMTQCVARTGPPPTRPLAFTFSGPNGFDSSPPAAAHHHQQPDKVHLMPPRPIQHRHSHHHQPSKSVSPPRRRPATCSDDPAGAPPANSQEFGRVLTPPEVRQPGLDEFANASWARRLNELSILKQQLLTSQSGATTATAMSGTRNATSGHESLPFKKRKISEPNMRY